MTSDRNFSLRLGIVDVSGQKEGEEAVRRTSREKFVLLPNHFHFRSAYRFSFPEQRVGKKHFRQVGEILLDAELMPIIREIGTYTV